MKPLIKSTLWSVVAGVCFAVALDLRWWQIALLLLGARAAIASADAGKP